MFGALKIDKKSDEGLQYLLRSLLESGKVKAVFTLKKQNENGFAVYSLITDPEEIKDALPFYPLMPNNAGQLLSNLTLNGAVTEPTAVVIRPCELRAFIELIKRKKANMDNMLIISNTCGGVYPLELTEDSSFEKHISDYWDSVKEGKIPDGIRPVCRACEHFVPGKHADVVIPLAGNKGKENETLMVINTEKGKKYLQDIDSTAPVEDAVLENDEINNLKSMRIEGKKKLFDGLGLEQVGLGGLVDIFGKCIGCRGCRAACPICYCQLCSFDSQNSMYKINLNELNRKKGIRIPPNSIYFHIIRMSHMSISCVGCGSCEDACPADIPISSIFKMVGETVHAVFDYLPGRDIDEEIPLKTFELDELSEVER